MTFVPALFLSFLGRSSWSGWMVESLESTAVNSKPTLSSPMLMNNRYLGNKSHNINSYIYKNVYFVNLNELTDPASTCTTVAMNMKY